LDDISSFDSCGHQLGEDVRGTSEARDTKRGELTGKLLIETGRALVVEREECDELNAGIYKRCGAF
jgi:hypothetical protein